MKKEKTIIIRSPRLKKIRNEFRVLLNLWVSDVMTSFLEKNHFEKELSRLDLAHGLSICCCLHCGNGDKDMIYRPDMKQWLCLECNSKIVYFEKLRAELQLDMGTDFSIEFFQRLEGKEGLDIGNTPRLRFKCGGQAYPLSKKILSRMGITQGVQKKFLELCFFYGGHCDCEIYLNAKEAILGL
jgi:hypothetical protein